MRGRAAGMLFDGTGRVGEHLLLHEPDSGAASQSNISGIGRLETRAYTEQRRLPHAVRPNEPDAIAMREPKGDVAEDKALAETLRDRLDRENAHARGTRWQRGQWNVPRPPTTERTIARPQRGHGSPARA